MLLSGGTLFVGAKGGGSGGTASAVQYASTMPTVSNGAVVLYTGETTSDYQKGHIYHGEQQSEGGAGSSYWSDITGPKSVTDTSSTSITLDTMGVHTNYHYGTLTALTISSVTVSDMETTFDFTCDSNGCTLSLPVSVNDDLVDAPVAGKRYLLSIRNMVAVGVNVDA